MKAAPLNLRADTPVESGGGRAIPPIASKPGRWQDRFTGFLAFAVYAVVLAAVFHRALGSLALYAWKADASSYILLIPVLAGYVIHLKWAEIGQVSPSRSWIGVGPAAVGVAAWAGVVLVFPSDLSLSILAFICFLYAGGFLFLGNRMMRLLAFPAFLLAFLIPLPEVVLEGLKQLLQVSSTYAAQGFFEAFATPYLRDDFVFQLPGITLRVAEECSGLNSTLSLLIVSLLAGHLFLTSFWKKALLTAIVLPLGIIRNGFRIFTLGMLCIHVSPDMIHSPIHHRGGPIFFALSLIPFCGLLLWLRHTDRKKAAAKGQVNAGAGGG